MVYAFKPLSAEHAREKMAWEYPAPYDRYHMDGTAFDIAFFIDPTNGYFGVWKDGALIGFCCFGDDGQVPGGDYSADALDVGAGFRPDLTGQGHGAEHLAAVLAFARDHFSVSTFRATIAEFNQRAQKACTALGFKIVGRFIATTNGDPYLILVRPAILVDPTDGR